MKLFSAPPLSQFAKPKEPAPDGADGAVKSRRTMLPEAPSAPRVMQIARLAQGGRWRVEAMRAHSEPCLLWFTRGQGRITFGGVTRGYGAHNAIFLPPGTMHGFEVGPQTHGMAIFFGRNPDIDLPDTAQQIRVRDATTQTELTVIVEAVSRELESDRPGSERAARHHLGLLGVWLERQYAALPTDTPRPDASRRLVARFSALLEREFRSGAGVADYAAQLGVTPTHLTRSCRATCGRPASDLLQDRRLYEARRLLAETRMPVKDIAEALGFTSAGYFARSFHARTGKTPSQFRRAG